MIPVHHHRPQNLLIRIISSAAGRPMIPKEEDGKGRWVDRQNRRGERERGSSASHVDELIPIVQRYYYNKYDIYIKVQIIISHLHYPFRISLEFK